MNAPLAIDAAATRSATDLVAARLRGLASELGAKYSMTLTLPTTEALRVVWFDRGSPSHHRPARPFLVLDGRAREAAQEAISQRVAANLRAGLALGLLPALQVGAEAIRGVYADRLSLNGADMPFAPLNPRYAAMKARHGLDPRTGVATGSTLSALQSAKVTVSRIG
jgi:hypothetical protein